jgi:hypothetical protein
MHKKRIDENINKIVGYRSPVMDFTVPARVMESRMWEIRYGPKGSHVQASDKRIASHIGGVEIGYPILTVQTSKSSREEAEQWIRSTEYTMADLYDEQGDDKGLLPVGVVLRAVPGRSLTENYEHAVRSEKDREAEAKLKLQRSMATFQETAAKAQQLNIEMEAMGIRPTDNKGIVRMHSIDSTRVVVDVDTLASLVAIAREAARTCDWCGCPGPLLPFGSVTLTKAMLCVTCHPSVLMTG